MSGKFADTNALLYAVTDDARKANAAEAILKGGVTISAQVLNEIANVLRRKWARSWEETNSTLWYVRDAVVDVVPVTIETHDLGVRIAQRYQLSIYDGMIVATALLADCDTLYSEDMHDGLLVEGRLRVVNPFRASR